jgi:hypothetical protein
MFVTSQNYRAFFKKRGSKYLYASRYVPTFTGPTVG